MYWLNYYRFSCSCNCFWNGVQNYQRFHKHRTEQQYSVNTLKIPPEKLQYRPLATVLEASKFKGKAYRACGNLPSLPCNTWRFHFSRWFVRYDKLIKSCAENRRCWTASRQEYSYQEWISHELEGIVVYAPETDGIYIPFEALSIINGTKVVGNKRV